jgi:hypothetical protein
MPQVSEKSPLEPNQALLGVAPASSRRAIILKKRYWGGFARKAEPRWLES